MTKNNSTFVFLLEALLFFRLAVTIMPAVGFYSNSFINIGTFLLIYLLLFAYARGNTIEELIKYVPIFLFGIYGIIVLAINNESVFDGIYELFMALQWPLAFIIVAKKKDYRLIRRLLIYVLAFYLITCITTYIGNDIFKGAARHMSNGNFANENKELMALYQSYNMGTFSFVYTIVILFPLILYMLRCYGKKRLHYFIIGLVVVAVIIKTEYTTALILLLSSFMLFLLPKNFSFRQLTLLSIGFVVIVLAYSTLLPSILRLIAEFSGSEQVAERLTSISEVRTGGGLDDNSDLSQRVELWTESWKLFTNNLLLGTGNESGGHSFILDNMAKYGLLGFISVIIVFRKMFKMCVKKYKSYEVYGYALFALIINVTQCLLNPVMNYFAFTFVIPLFCVYFMKFEEDEKNKKAVANIA